MTAFSMQTHSWCSVKPLFWPFRLYTHTRAHIDCIAPDDRPDYYCFESFPAGSALLAKMLADSDVEADDAEEEPLAFSSVVSDSDDEQQPVQQASVPSQLQFSAAAHESSADRFVAEPAAEASPAQEAPENGMEEDRGTAGSAPSPAELAPLPQSQAAGPIEGASRALEVCLIVEVRSLS